MAIWTKEVLSAWKWILGCGFIVSLLSATVNYYFFSGIAKNMALMGIFLLYSTVITLICISVFLYRNINLNGVISFWGAFSILILIFFTIVILYIPISNLVFFGTFSSNEEYTRLYYQSLYSNNEEGGIYEEARNDDIKILISLFFVFNALLISKVLSTKTPQY